MAGELDDTDYCLLNGFPTKAPFKAVGCCCASSRSDSLPRVDGYDAAWVQAFVDHGRTGSELIAVECTECTAARRLKRRVLYDDDPLDEALRAKPFDTAPGLYLYNIPRYETTMLRAREYARANDLRLYWFYAQDVPLSRGDRDLEDEELQRKRVRWLGSHDQRTAHLCSVCPLAKGMPIKLLDSIDRNREYQNQDLENQV